MKSEAIFFISALFFLYSGSIVFCQKLNTAVLHKAESYFKIGQFENVIDEFSPFLTKDSKISLPKRKKATILSAISYLELSEYKKAENI
ncbi:MAG: hypothetical protein KDD19_13870, partial [Phaeodactylibacter sp.]|nr:hypothetical protein [Phaeodactylibacter sp.]